MIDKEKYPALASCQPNQCIGARIGRANRILSNLYRKHIASYGITNSQMTLLFVISKKGETTQNAICEMLYLEKSTVSRNLKLLLTEDLIKKEGRTLLATEKGMTLLEKMIPAWDKAMKEARTILGEEGEEAVGLLMGRLKELK